MIVFAQANGEVIDVSPSSVYQGSNLSGSIFFVAPISDYNSVMVAFTLPNGKSTESYGMTRVNELNGFTDKLGNEYRAWEWTNKNAEVTEFPGTVTVQFFIYFNDGNDGNGKNDCQLLTTASTTFTVEKGVSPLLTDPPDEDTYQKIRKYLSLLDGRTKNVPILVKSIKKVAPNAFTYTDNSDVESAPIVLESDGSAPLPMIDGAYTVVIPAENELTTVWTPVDTSDLTKGYYHTLTAEMHGQMQYGATANDLWVSFDEADEDAFKGAYEDYTVNAAGDVTITVSAPIALTVRVWNGKGVEGKAATIEVGEVTRLPFDAAPTVTNSGTESQAVFDFGIPQLSDKGTYPEMSVGYATNAQNDGAGNNIVAQFSSVSADIEGIREDITNEAHFRGYLETNAEIQALSATPNDYAYSAQSGTVWIYQTATGWKDSEKPVPDQITPKGTAIPLMDGVGSSGTANEYAPIDHRHPTDTTRASTSVATQSANGLMSASDKIKLDGLGTGNVTGVKGSAETVYRTGNVNLTPADIGAVNKAGDTMTGQLLFQNYSDAIKIESNYPNLRMKPNTANSLWMLESDPIGTNDSELRVYKRDAETDSNIYNIAFPQKSGTIALLDDVPGSMAHTEIDASALSGSTWYPVTMKLLEGAPAHIQIIDKSYGDSGTVSWATHSSKTINCIADWYDTPENWGGFTRNLFVQAFNWGMGDNILGEIGQLRNSGTEYIYVRGGAKYQFYTSTNAGTPMLRTSSYTINEETISPTSIYNGNVPQTFSAFDNLFTYYLKSSTNIDAQGIIQEKGQRVYSPNNPPPNQDPINDSMTYIGSLGNLTFWNRFCIQWGQSSKTTSITFPIQFDAAAYSVLVTSQETAKTNYGWNYAYNITKSGFNVVTDTAFSWVAIGLKM